MDSHTTSTSTTTTTPSQQTSSSSQSTTLFDCLVAWVNMNFLMPKDALFVPKGLELFNIVYQSKL